MDLLFLLFLLLVLTKERVATQLVYAHSLLRVLPQWLVHELPCLPTHEHVRRNRYLILDNLDQLFFLLYFKRTLSHQHLVSHYTKRPYIYFFIVLVAFQNLRRNVRGRSTKGTSHFVVTVYRPPKVTQFSNALPLSTTTSCITTF